MLIDDVGKDTFKAKASVITAAGIILFFSFNQYLKSLLFNAAIIVNINVSGQAIKLSNSDQKILNTD